jgi:hypothetical protein
MALCGVVAMAKGVKTGGGSRKGKPNKIPSDLKLMAFGALEAGGGQKWLEQQMIDNPAAFMSFLGKFVPKDLNVGGQSDNPVLIKAIQRTIVYSKKDDEA